MRFSIIIPLYNKASTIRRALYSALDQVNIHPDKVEIIVVDDGSTDGSAQQVRAVMDEQSSRTIRLLQQDNSGVSAARNLGARFSRYEYLTFLDADDAYKPAFLHTLEQLIKAYANCDFYATAYDFVSMQGGTRRPAKLAQINLNQDHQKLNNYFDSAANGDLPFCSSSIGIRKDVFDELGGFPEGENMGEDQSLFTQMALHCDIAYSPISCANYYTDVNGSLMQTEPVINEMPFSQHLQQQLDNYTLPNHLRPSVERYISGHLLDLVRRNLNNGNRNTAKRLLADKRSKEKWVKWCYWWGRSLI